MLRGVDIDVPAGSTAAVIGPSGSGKTTLLSLLGCVLYPTEGHLWVDGQEINRLNENQLARLRLNTIGFVFQSFNLLAPLSAEDNVMMPMRLQGVGNAEGRKRAYAALEMVGMMDRRKQLPKQLSGGQQQMLAVARALMSRPKLLLMDEPSLGLAPLIVAEIFKLIAELRQLGMTILIVEQNVRMTLNIVDRAYLLNLGTVEFSGTPDQIRAEADIEKTYLGGGAVKPAAAAATAS